MYDFLKLRLRDSFLIKRVESQFEFKSTFNRITGEVRDFPKLSKLGEWEFKIYSPNLMEITGSLHRYWNNGTNENDFSIIAARLAVDKFCEWLGINSFKMQICNLEFGVNIIPNYEAREILEEVVCIKNKIPNRPYQGRNFEFLEFPHSEGYIKIYDKGGQYKTKNILRLEFKAVKSRQITSMGIDTMVDLTRIEPMIECGKKLVQISNNIVFKESSIDLKKLSLAEEKHYLTMKDPYEWSKCRGHKTPNHWKREKKFIAIVKKYGNRDLSGHIEKLISEKVFQLVKGKGFHT